MRVIYDMTNDINDLKFKKQTAPPPPKVAAALSCLVKHLEEETGSVHVHYMNGPYMIVVTRHPDVIEENLGMSHDLEQGICISCGVKHGEEDGTEDGTETKHKLDV